MNVFRSSPRSRRAFPPLLVLVASALAGLAGWPAIADTLALPTAENAEVVAGPYTTVTVTADGRVGHGAPMSTVPPGEEVVLPALLASLRGFRAAEPTGLVLIAGDGRADFRSVRAVLATGNGADVGEYGFLAGPETTPPRALRVAQLRAEVETDPLAEAFHPPPLPSLVLRLHADRLVLERHRGSVVHVPRVAGRLDLDVLAALLDEDRRLHPKADGVVIDTQDGVVYADMFATLDLTRGKGYARTLVAGGGAWAPEPPEAAPALDVPVEGFVGVRLHPNGDVDLRVADGSVDVVRHAAVTRYEAWCDASTCDLVLRTARRRVHLGSRPRDVPVPSTLFGRPVHTRAGRLALPEPAREGVFSPLVQVAEADTSDVPSVVPLGALPDLDKTEIDAVIKGNMATIRSCYQALQRRAATSQGRVVMKFRIDAGGHVSAVMVKASQIEDALFEGCMNATFRGFQFPKPRRGANVIVSYPFIFTPG